MSRHCPECLLLTRLEQQLTRFLFRLARLLTAVFSMEEPHIPGPSATATLLQPPPRPQHTAILLKIPQQIIQLH